jgi:signal transduction histidine kinase
LLLPVGWPNYDGVERVQLVLRQRGGPSVRRLRLRLAAFPPPSPVLVAALVSAAATTLIVAVPSLRFAYRAPQLHSALETAATLIGLLAAYLVFGRFRRSGHLDDFVLCCSLALLAGSNLFFAVLPEVLGGGSDDFGTWARLFGQLLGSAVFAAASVTPRWRVRPSRGQSLLVAIMLPVVLAAVAAAVYVFGSFLPAGVELLPTADGARRPRLDSDATLLGAQLAGVALYCFAAIGFSRKGRATGDDLMKWLAVGAMFGAFARLNYFLYPSLYTEWVYSGDFFRLAFYISILTAAAREISSYWETLSRTAVLEERRRIARDLHDGLAQELAFIGRNLRRLDEREAPVARVAASAERALSESRRAIAALTKPLDEPLDVVLANAVRETAEREGTVVDLVLAEGIDLDYSRRDALIRIACEATTNAARHGRARLVRVELATRRRHVRLRVSDDGIGFDTGATARASGGFGLVSMRERAHAVGGSFDVHSRPGAGTTVEALV